MKLLFVIPALLIFFNVSAHQNQRTIEKLQEAQHCYDLKKYKKAIKIYQEIYNTDETMLDSIAKFNMAECFLNGWGVAQSSANAFRWFEESAKAGCVMSMYCVGLFLKEGVSPYYDNVVSVIYKDLPKAKYWFKKAAYAGNINAMYELGLLYEIGVLDLKSLDKYDETTKEFFSQQVQQENNVHIDYSQAKYWFQKACSEGYSKACEKLQKQ